MLGNVVFVYRLSGLPVVMSKHRTSMRMSRTDSILACVLEMEDERMIY